jgi:hypothetical protein
MLQPGEILRMAQLKRVISEFFDHGPKRDKYLKKKKKKKPPLIACVKAMEQ